MRQLYVANPHAFEDRTPKLAAQLKNSDGTFMKGIAFGQDPDTSLGSRHIRFSFNSLREGVFNTLYQYNHVSVDSSDFDTKLAEKFREVKINPDHPAFNFPPEKGRMLFSEIATNSA